MSKIKLRTSVVFSIAAVTLAIVPSIYFYIARNRKQNRASTEEDVKTLHDDLTSSDSLPQHIEREVKKERRRQAKMKDLAMKSPMYDNVLMVDPDGELLSSISGKKGKWYVSKNLARWTNESQTCIQLLFEPKGRVSLEGDGKTSDEHTMGVYTLTQKRNECVVCGSEKHLMRLYVVPYVYRSLLPKKYKSHMSHDIVVLCGNCNLRCQQQYHLRMNELEESLRPMGTKRKFEVNHELYHIRSCALALWRWREKLPPEKIFDYEQLVRKHLSSLPNQSAELELNSETLEKLSNIEYRITNPRHVPGPQLVVQSLNNDDAKIEQFVREWRQHFLDLAHPRNLPSGWSVHNPVASEKEIRKD